MSDSGGNHDRKNALWEEGFGNPRQPTMVPNNGSLYSGHEQFGMVHPDGDAYTVLPIGNGNFIKVYHKNDESMNFSNYELFSSNTFGPQNMMKTMQPQQENFFHQGESSSMVDDSSTSMFINQLVGQNWVPNNSGTYSQFGEPQQQQQQHPQQPMMPREHFMGYGTAPTNLSDSYSYAATQSNYNSQPCLSAVSSPPSIINNTNSTSGTNGSFQHESILKKADVKKPRMVAEVKPMRMTYSDVLSKNVSLTKADSTANTVTTNDGPNVQPKIKSGKNVDKSKNNSHFVPEKKVGSNADDKESAFANKTKLHTGSVPRIDDRENGSNQARDHRSFAEEEFSKDSKSHDGDSSKASSKKRNTGAVTGNGTTKSSTKPKNVNGSTNDLNKKRVQNNVDFEQVKVEETKNSKNAGYFYNVTKNESQSDKMNKQYQSSFRKVNNRTTTITSSSLPPRSNNKPEKTSTSYQKRNQRSRQNNTYAMLAKLFEKWLEYMVKFVLWLFTLVYDVVVLSFGIIFERCHTFVDYSRQWYQILRTELKNNSGLPTAYCKKLWVKFDKKFAKDSKWAFWRRIFNRKKVKEPIPEYVRSGRLPSTGDEAMYSLMNCKGKDAYR